MHSKSNPLRKVENAVVQHSIKIKLRFKVMLITANAQKITLFSYLQGYDTRDGGV